MSSFPYLSLFKIFGHFVAVDKLINMMQKIILKDLNFKMYFSSCDLIMQSTRTILAIPVEHH